MAWYKAGGGSKPKQTKTVTPSTGVQEITADSGKELEKVTVNAMPSGALKTPTVNASGLVTSGVQTSGYIGTSAESTLQLSTQGARTFTPTITNTTLVSSGKYTTGAIICKGDANLTADNIAKGKSIFGVNGSYETPFVPTNGTVREYSAASSISKYTFVSEQSNVHPSSNIFGGIDAKESYNMIKIDEQRSLVVYGSKVYCGVVRIGNGGAITYGTPSLVGNGSTDYNYKQQAGNIPIITELEPNVFMIATWAYVSAYTVFYGVVRVNSDDTITVLKNMSQLESMGGNLSTSMVIGCSNNRILHFGSNYIRIYSYNATNYNTTLLTSTYYAYNVATSYLRGYLEMKEDNFIVWFPVFSDRTQASFINVEVNDNNELSLNGLYQTTGSTALYVNTQMTVLKANENTILTLKNVSGKVAIWVWEVTTSGTFTMTYRGERSLTTGGYSTTGIFEDGKLYVVAKDSDSSVRKNVFTLSGTSLTAKSDEVLSGTTIDVDANDYTFAFATKNGGYILYLLGHTGYLSSSKHTWKAMAVDIENIIPSTSNVIGITMEDIASGGVGKVATFS